MDYSDVPIEAQEPIIFNNRDLPLATYWMELLVSILPSLPKPAVDFLLDLHYCSYTVRCRPAHVVRTLCQEITQHIIINRSNIIAEISDRLTWANPEKMLGEWLTALQLMEMLSFHYEECQWTRREGVKHCEAVRNGAQKMLDFLSRNSV